MYAEIFVRGPGNLMWCQVSFSLTVQPTVDAITLYVFILFFINIAENVNTFEINETLKQLLSEVKGQKQELNSLKEEVIGTSVSVSSKVKKLKKEKELKWRFEEHKIQFVFNTGLEDGLKQALWAYSNKKGDYLAELLNELLDKIKERNKLIRIADSSEGGWETVRQYESNPLASDSEDESRIRRAEAQAIRKSKTKRPRVLGVQCLWLPECFLAHKPLSEERSTLKGKHLLPRGRKCFPFKVDRFPEGERNQFW